MARVMRGRTIVDLRNLLDHEAFVGEGFVVHSIGRRTRLPGKAIAHGAHFAARVAAAALG
jgi:hypothetical protein